MTYKKKYSMFISSTYEDLKEERREIYSVALENDFIPVGMEQFHAAPASQWDVITKMIDDCDLYLLIIGGCYGTIDPDSGCSYTEKEYNYAKVNNIPIIVLIENQNKITMDKIDEIDRMNKQRLLEIFRNKVKDDGNTVDFFDDINDLKYKSSAFLKNAKEYIKDSAGGIRYKDLQSIINHEIEVKNKYNEDSNKNKKQCLKE